METDLKNIFGVIKPPPGTPPGDNALSVILTVAIKLFIVIAGLAGFLYLLLGAFDWITSGGDKEKLSKARLRITHALIGIVLLFIVLAVVATLEQLVFGKNLCFGLTCSFRIPTVTSP